MTYFQFGQWKTSEGAMDEALASDILKSAETARARISAYPIEKILDLCEQVADLWSNPNYERRQRMEKVLPELTGFSSAMIDLAFQELASIFRRKNLEKKMRTELGLAEGPLSQVKFDDRTGTHLQWEPIGVLLHVLSGNVFLVGAGSLLEGLMTRNVSILKMSSAETQFMPELVQSFQEVDRDGVVSGSIALIEYSSKNKSAMDTFKKGVDGIIVWGGEDAVRGYRNDVPARTRVIVFGPKLSVAVATLKGVDEVGIDLVADRIAKELSIWDQNACTAPQVLFVESKALGRGIAEQTAKSMEVWQKRLPVGPADLNTAVEIQKWRGRYEIQEARGHALVFGSQGSVNWTIIYDETMALESSPLHRTIRIVPFEKAAEVAEQIGQLRSYVQTVGLMTTQTEFSEWCRTLGSLGVLRILDLGDMSTGGEIDHPHDGMYDLPQLMNQVVIQSRRFPKEMREYLPLGVRNQDLEIKLAETLKHASTFAPYQNVLSEISVKTFSDLTQLPLLTRADLERYLPPVGRGLLSSIVEGGYVTRSGGSTGEPVYSVLNGADWKALVRNGVRQFRTLGLLPSDRMANFMMAGDLYGSFVSFDHICQAVGVQSFNFCHQLSAELFLKVANQFSINVVIGIPSTILPLLREVHAMDPGFRLDKIIYAGLPLSKDDANWLRVNLRVARISSVIGTTDSGQIAYQCEKQSGQLHHLVEDFVHVELVDDSGAIVPEGETGKIALTCLEKSAVPLVRYLVGDQGRILSGTCACGRTDRVIEYQGRADNVLSVGLLNLSYQEVERGLEGIPYSLLQIIARTKSQKEVLVINLERPRAEGAWTPEKAQGAFLEKLPAIQKRVTEGALSIELNFFPPGGLPRNPRTGKVKLIVDERLNG